MRSLWSITGIGVVIAIAATWLLVSGGLLILWRRLAARSLWTVAARVGGIVLSNVLVLMLAFVLLNDQYEFYTSWSELGSDVASGGFLSPEDAPQAQLEATLSAGADAAATLKNGQTTGHVRELAPPLPRGGGSGLTRTYSVTGASSGVTTDVTVVLPQNYRESSATYPVLVALHGTPGTPGTLLHKMTLAAGISEAVDAGSVRDPLLVVPNTRTSASADNECADIPDVKMETFLGVDLPKWVSDSFRVSTDRTAWATTGISEGGWCAAMLAMLHPHRFGSALVFGGYFQPVWPTRTGNPFPPDDPWSQRYDLIAMARELPPPVAIWAEAPKNDEIAYPSITSLAAAAKAPLALHALIPQSGGHVVSSWRPFLPTALTWLGQVAPGFHPNAIDPAPLPAKGNGKQSKPKAKRKCHGPAKAQRPKRCTASGGSVKSG